MSSTKNKGNALGAKTARACDSCIRNRARWYCAADDAFLCQACDSSVHSANLLARRHHRVCLKIVPYNNTNKNSSSGISNIRAPSWHKGFTKKPRTPRHGKRAHKALKSPSDVVVPEVCPEDTNSNSHEESVNQLLYRVPATPSPEEGKNDLLGCESEFEIAEFGAEVESLLGEGLENECVGMEELGLVDTKKLEEYGSGDCCVDGGNVKVEEEESQQVVLKENDEQKRKKMLLLRLDYEAVISAWTHQKSPWTTGAKPDLGTHQCWPHCMGTCGVELHHPSGEMGGLLEKAMADGGREARVLRYREKRRTRLFSKKIRYEVRKLNAEKRPRMKGRFVKRLH